MRDIVGFPSDLLSVSEMSSSWLFSNAERLIYPLAHIFDLIDFEMVEPSGLEID